MKTIAGVALAAVVGVCALAGGAQRVEAAIINYSGQGTYDGDNYYIDQFTYNTYTNRGTANVVYGFSNINYYLSEFSSTVKQVSFWQNSLNFADPKDGQSVTLSIDFDAEVKGIVPDGNGGSSIIDHKQILSFGVLIFAVADANGIVSLQSQGSLDGYYDGWDEPSFVSISTVPLPGSAPLFGGAILAIWGVGYGWRRLKTAPAG